MWLPQTSSAAGKKLDPSEKTCYWILGCQAGSHPELTVRAYQELLLQKEKQGLNKVNCFLAAEVSAWKMWYKEIRTGSLNHHLLPHLRMTRVCRHTAAETYIPHPLLGTALSSPPYLKYFITLSRTARSEALPFSFPCIYRLCVQLDSNALWLQHCWQCWRKRGKSLQEKLWSSKTGK